MATKGHRSSGLSNGISGPAGTILGDLGAQVINVESVALPDHARRCRRVHWYVRFVRPHRTWETVHFARLTKAKAKIF